MLESCRTAKGGAVCGLLAVILFSVLYSVAAFGDPGYVFLDSYLSDIGVGPTAWAFNAALILSGSLIVGFALIGMAPALGPSVLSRAGAALLALSGALLVNIGVFTENCGDIHYAVSVAFFLILLVALGILACALRLREVLGRVGWMASAFAFVFGLLLLAMGFSPFTETLAVLTALVWGTIISLRLLAECQGWFTAQSRR